MTDQELKDQFACAVMQEFIKEAFRLRRGFLGISHKDFKAYYASIPKDAYDTAEEMMRERAKRQ